MIPDGDMPTYDKAPPCCGGAILHWNCHPIIERLAAHAIAFNPPIYPGAISTDSVRSLFLLAYPMYGNRRFELWLGNWGVVRTTIVVEEIEIDVLLTSTLWAQPLRDCVFGGGCGLLPPDCPAVSFPYASPSG